MAHVVPSQIVRFIAASYAWSDRKGGADSPLLQDQAPTVASIVALADQVPEELLAALDGRPRAVSPRYLGNARVRRGLAGLR
jgi:hypothetical protein